MIYFTANMLAKINFNSQLKDTSLPSHTSYCGCGYFWIKSCYIWAGYITDSREDDNSWKQKRTRASMFNVRSVGGGGGVGWGWGGGGGGGGVY